MSVATKPNGDDVSAMLVDILNGKPFSGPTEWQPVWDEISAEVDAAPEGCIIDIPAGTPTLD